MPQASELAARREQVKKRIREAKFTGKGDLDTVLPKYDKYIDRIEGVIRDAKMADMRLAFVEEDDTTRAVRPMPSIVVPPSPELRLADGQILLMLPEIARRRSGGHGATQLAVIEGGRVNLRFARNRQGDGAVAFFDDFCQQVVPWKVPNDRSSLKKVLKESKSEAAAAKALLRMNVAGLRRYGVQQELTVRHEGIWMDAEVIGEGDATAKHQLRLEDGSSHTLQLHPWNAAPRELPRVDFEEMRRWWVESLRSEHSTLADAVLGRRLNVLQQCVAIDVSSDSATFASAKDASGLASGLLSLAEQQREGKVAEAPCAALLTGRPAAGKTSLLSQIIVHSLESSEEVVPILVRVQQLQEYLLEQPDAFGRAWNWGALLPVYGGTPPRCLHTTRPSLLNLVPLSPSAQSMRTCVKGTAKLRQCTACCVRRCRHGELSCCLTDWTRVARSATRLSAT